MSLPPDYAERVYAGVLGKLIGVYLGRPFEGWSHRRIVETLGEVDYYVHERFGAPLVVTDDDVSGTFTFLRALPDHGNRRDLTPAEIGRTWLNYIVEDRTILWWGGMGNSTEHTAFLRLGAGVEAPASGSAAVNGRVVAEQIGAQIFVDGWAMVAPGDPEFAADLARRAASVSHDGEAIHGARVIAAMESLAFVERDLDALLDVATGLIPRDSTVYRLIADLRAWHADEPDWRVARARVEARYGYDRYGGNCHVVPNHALIVLALLYGGDDVGRSLSIATTCGWDTDCNAGNVGCLLGIKNGLAGLDAGADFRGPVADRLYLPTADGGRAITDALAEAGRVVAIGRALAGEPHAPPKGGARFHFDLPGAVQGFEPEDRPETRGAALVENAAGHSLAGRRSLAVRFRGLAPGRVARVATPTFIPSLDLAHAFEARGYALLASPTLYPGQRLEARVEADPANDAPVEVRLFVRPYGEDDALGLLASQPVALPPGGDATLAWTVPDTGSAPVASVGLAVHGAGGATGAVYLDTLDWGGAPDAAFDRPAHRGTMWRRAWVDARDHRDPFDAWEEPYRLVQNRGRGVVTQGTSDWRDYEARATLTPHLCRAGGLAVRAQGQRRYYALLLDEASTRLVRVVHDETTLAEAEGGWTPGEPCALTLRVEGDALVAFVDGERRLEARDPDGALPGGGVGLVVEEGRIGCEGVAVRPLQERSPRHGGAGDPRRTPQPLRWRRGGAP